MKQVFNNGELAHVWARQSQESGRGSSMSFDTTEYESYGLKCSRIYSYNTLMGAIYTKADGSSLTVLNKASYSSTTCKHQSHIAYAVNHKNTVNYPVNIGYNAHLFSVLMKSDFDRMVGEAHEIAAGYVASAARRRKETTKNSDLMSANGILASIEKIAEFFSHDYVKPETLDDVAAEIQKARDAHNERQRQIQRERIAEQAEQLELWKNGDDVRVYFDVVALRVKDDEIQTTKGARIPVEDARNAWPLFNAAIKSGRGITANSTKLTLGGYPFTSFNRNNDGLLIVGCHQIPVTEIVRMAGVLGLS